MTTRDPLAYRLKPASLLLACALALAPVLSQPAMAAPAQAARAVPGSVGSNLLDLAAREGIEVRGPIQNLSQPAPTGTLPSETEAALNRLLKGQQFVVKRAVVDGVPRIVQVTLLSGQKGQAPAALPVQVASTSAQPPPPQAQPISAVSTTSTPSSPISRTTGLLEAAARQLGTANASQPPPAPDARTGTSAKGTEPPPNFTTAPPQLSPEQQAALARMTQQASGDLNALVTALRAACPAGETCN